MLETVFHTRTMDFVPLIAEPAARLHLLVVDADTAVRSACAEIAASLGYAVETTGDLSQARTLLRGKAADILLVNLASGLASGLCFGAWNWDLARIRDRTGWHLAGPGTHCRGEAALSRHFGHRHDRLELSKCGR